MKQPTFIPLADYHEHPVADMKQRAAAFADAMRKRRTVRDFDRRAVPREVIEDCLRAAGSAPSGANMQPWHFVVVTDPEIKRRIRSDAEQEEREFYQHKAPQEWLDALAPLAPTSTSRFSKTRLA